MSKLIMTAYFIFIIGNITCMIIEGGWFGDDDMDVLKALTGYSVMEVSGAGLIAIPKLAVGFFTHGLPTMILWNYSFLEGGWSLFTIFLYCVTIGVLYPICMMIMNVASGILGSVR